MRIEKGKQKNPQSEKSGPMLFARNALPSGPQACFFAEKGTAKVGGKGANSLDQQYPRFDQAGMILRASIPATGEKSLSKDGLRA